jgi:hypothetical protein
MAACYGHRDLVEVLFYGTKPDPEVPDWSVDGIMRALNQACTYFFYHFIPGYTHEA